MITEIRPDTRLVDLTVGQLLNLMEKSRAEQNKSRAVEYGIGGIARIFNCSISTANRIKKSHIIDDAISQTGRVIVIDIEKAKELFISNKSK